MGKLEEFEKLWLLKQRNCFKGNPKLRKGRRVGHARRKKKRSKLRFAGAHIGVSNTSRDGDTHTHRLHHNLATKQNKKTNKEKTKIFLLLLPPVNSQVLPFRAYCDHFQQKYIQRGKTGI